MSLSGQKKEKENLRLQEQREWEWGMGGGVYSHHSGSDMATPGLKIKKTARVFTA